MALTLIESAKLIENPIQRAVIETFASGSDILSNLPVNTITGNASRFNREETLPSIGFRGVNEAYSEGVGVVNPITEPLMIIGGELDVDKFIIKTDGEEARAIHEAMKLKALALSWTLKFIKGDQTSDNKEFDGIQVRCSGNQVINNGTGSGGTALSLAKLDELIDTVDNPTHLIMNKTMRRLLTQAARNYTVGGFITWDKGMFGQRVYFYNDLPILIADYDNTNSQILPFTEAAYTGASTTSSIYCVSLGDGMLTGIQNAPMEVEDLGLLQSKPVYRTRVEWYAGIALYHARAAARLRYIKNAAVTA